MESCHNHPFIYLINIEIGIITFGRNRSYITQTVLQRSLINRLIDI